MRKMNVSKCWRVSRLVANTAIICMACGVVMISSGCARFRDLIYLSEIEAIDIARRECKVEEEKMESYLVEADLLTWEIASARLDTSDINKYPRNTQTWFVSFIEMYPLKTKEGTSAIPLTRCNLALDAITGESMGIITTHRIGGQPASPTLTQTPEIVATAMTARLEGILVEQDGCLRVISHYTGTTYTLVWPADVSATFEVDTVRVINGIVRGDPTEVILNINEGVLLSGGEVKHLGEDLIQTVPSHCPDPYWVVGFTIKPAIPTEDSRVHPGTLLEYAINPCEVIAGESPDKPAFKGIELYGRQTEDGEWVYTILYGTNRNKTVQEAGSGAMDIGEVKGCFCKLADGENVIWMDSAYNPETGEMISLPKPPPAIIKDIQDGAATCGVNLEPD